MTYCDKEALHYFRQILKCRELEKSYQKKCIIKLNEKYKLFFENCVNKI